MPRFGSHLSIAGGYYKALISAKEHGFETVQIFTKNNNQWVGKLITDEERDLFAATLKETGIQCPTAHDSYLINLASPDATLYRRSIDAFVDEVNRAEVFRLPYLVMHPGTPTDGDEAMGLDRIVQALDEVHERCQDAKVQVLLETTAGQGKSLGHRFEHLAYLLKHVKASDRLGVCVDTCHIFAAGYALSPKKQYLETFKQFDQHIGIDRLKVFHINDSLKPQGSRVDRHAHIGKGCLGLEPFSLLLNDRRFRNHLMILETPKEGDAGEDMDYENLRTLQDLLLK